MSERSNHARCALIAVGAVLVLAAALRVAYPDVAYFNIHTARDCYRTIEMISGHDFRTHGPELRFGGQTPGWLLYPLMAPPLIVSHNPIGLTIWIGLLATIGVWVTYLIGRDFAGGHRAGLIAALLSAVQVPILLSLRYQWNPCFLAFLTPLFLWTLLQVCVAKRPWFFPALVLVWCAGASVHFSTHLLLIPTIAAFIIARPRLPWKTIIVALGIIGVTFGPYVLREIRDRGEDLRQIITSDQTKVEVDDVRAPGERWRINFNMPIVAANHLRTPVPEGPIAFTESNVTTDFTHFVRFYDQLDEEGTAPWLVRAATWLSQIWPLWLVVAIIVGVVALRRKKRAKATEADVSRDRGLLITLLWLLLPAGVLLFFNFYRTPGSSGVVSFRYFYVFAPAQFLLLGWVLDHTMARSAAWKIALWALLLVHAAGSAWVMGEFLTISHRTGVVFVHNGYPERHIYTISLKNRLVDYLVDDLHLAAEDVDWRLSGYWIFLNQWWTEDEIDYLLKTHPRIQENEPNPDAPLIRLHTPHLRMYDPTGTLHTDFEQMTGLVEDEIEIVSHEYIGKIGVLQYRLRDPNATPPPFNMANRWEHMGYR